MDGSSEEKLSTTEDVEHDASEIDSVLAGVTVLPKPWISKESIASAVRQMNKSVKSLFVHRKKVDERLSSCENVQSKANRRIRELETKLAVLEGRMENMIASQMDDDVQKGVQISEEQMKGQEEHARLLDQGILRLNTQIEEQSDQIRKLEKEVKDCNFRQSNGTFAADQVVCKIRSVATDPLSKRSAVTLGQAIDKIMAAQQTNKEDLIDYVTQKASKLASQDEFVDITAGVKKVCANLDDLLQQFYEEGILDDPPPPITYGWEPSTDHWANVAEGSAGEDVVQGIGSNVSRSGNRNAKEEITERKMMREMRLKETKEMADKERAAREKLWQQSSNANTDDGTDPNTTTDAVGDLPRVLNVIEKAVEHRVSESEDDRRHSRLASLLHKHRSKFKVSHKINEMHDTLEGQFSKIWSEILSVRQEVSGCISAVDNKADISTVELRIAIKFDEVISELESSLRKAGQDESYFKQAATELFETCKQLNETKANKSDVVELRKRLMVTDKVSDQLHDIIGTLESKLSVEDAMELFSRTMPRAEMGPLLAKLHKDLRLALQKEGTTMSGGGGFRNGKKPGSAPSEVPGTKGTGNNAQVKTRQRAASSLGPGGQSLGGGFQYRGNVNKHRPTATTPGGQRGSALGNGVEPHWSVGMLASPMIGNSTEKLPPVVKLDQGSSRAQQIYDRMKPPNSVPEVATPNEVESNMRGIVEGKEAISPASPVTTGSDFVVTVPLKSMPPAF